MNTFFLLGCPIGIPTLGPTRIASPPKGLIATPPTLSVCLASRIVWSSFPFSTNTIIASLLFNGKLFIGRALLDVDFHFQLD